MIFLIQKMSKLKNLVITKRVFKKCPNFDRSALHCYEKIKSAAFLMISRAALPRDSIQLAAVRDPGQKCKWILLS